MFHDQKPQMLSDAEEMKMLAHLDLDIEELEQRLELAPLIADWCGCNGTNCGCNGTNCAPNCGANCPSNCSALCGSLCNLNCRSIC